MSVDESRIRLNLLIREDPMIARIERVIDKDRRKVIVVACDELEHIDPRSMPRGDPFSRERAILASEITMENESLDPDLEVGKEHLDKHRINLKDLAK